MAEKSFLYLLPQTCTAKQLAEALPFLKKEAVQVWTEVNILGVELANGQLLLEDMAEQLLGEEDEKLLSELSMKQVYACDYEEEDAAEVKKIFQSLQDTFGGILASDTEDFKPFFKPEEL